MRIVGRSSCQHRRNSRYCLPVSNLNDQITRSYRARQTIVRLYKALLRGNSLEWIGEAPERSEDYPITVEVTVLEESYPAEARSRGDEMAAILEKLAESGAVSDITDPVAWQRDLRQDRPLSSRAE
jgi:hypothetical protein